MNWKTNLHTLLLNAVGKEQAVQDTDNQQRQISKQFFALIAEAFDEIKFEIEQHERHVIVHKGHYAYAINIHRGSKLEFSYAVKVRKHTPTDTGSYSFYSATSFDSKHSVQRYNFAKIHTIDKQRIIQDFMRAYQNYLEKTVAEN